ncbi:DUF2339 domain-containing protein [Rhizobium glycinendophyticum]|uniref:DUF2339 domain-containing protein n=1 Tax=Rhizobium glycinendophyticum TaxID=2589807 RepID=A0A504UNE3_9HYPH|nr:DUF2339 domain-containing protein [Rhizobium glycinendophyticum]TPP10526.1 DUF2339 domain-containing protein [Rhizobium glycinendophyticum]
MFEILPLILIGILFFSMRGSAKRIDRLEQELGAVREQLLRLGQGEMSPLPAENPAAAVDVGEDAARADASAEIITAPEAMPVDSLGEPASKDAPAIAARAGLDGTVSSSPAESVVPKAPAESLENLLGARWAVWAGGLALALGGVFLVRYSIESGLLGPGVRLSLAALFGLLLMAAGELVRRKALPQATALYANAMVPGILTAAGAVALFGAIYAAHGIYDFIGPATAFVLLALTAFAVLGLSLLHGQALAGLGLAGSMLTPLLVSSNSPSPWTLFIFLTVAQVATAIASRMRGWQIVPALAQVGLGLWALIGLFDLGDLTPVTLSLIAMIAAWVMIWPGNTEADLNVADEPLSWEAVGRRMATGRLGLDITMALSALIPSLAMLAITGPTGIFPTFCFASLIAVLASAGAARQGAFWPTMIAAIGALIGSLIETDMITQVQTVLDGVGVSTETAAGFDRVIVLLLFYLGALFTLLGLSFIRRRGAVDTVFSTLWAALGGVMPVLLATVSFVFYGVYGGDWHHGLFALATGTVLLASAEWLERAGLGPRLRRARDLLLFGSFAAYALALHTLTDGLFTTLLLAILGFVYLMATRLRPWSGLPWIMVAALCGVLFRIAWDPTLVGPDALSRTPLFNQLLAGYGVPALIAILSAYELRRWPGARVKNALQGLASLMGLLTIAILVRHAMNGGVLDASTPTLGEQSIYTLLVIGLSGILMTLDLKSPSAVFRSGSMAAGVVSVLQVLSLHLGALNPYVTGESTGSWPLINLMLIGYLIPGLGYAGLAFYARDKRPLPYVILLACSGTLLGFAWVTLSVRRFWQGEFIAYWKGFEQAETYSYSVAWLAIGVGLLALGSRFDARSLRIASAVIVIVTVAKVFLIDMANLGGVLRALSFIGLGFVLIGIGLFYQKILTSKVKPVVAAAREDEATGI